MSVRIRLGCAKQMKVIIYKYNCFVIRINSQSKFKSSWIKAEYFELKCDMNGVESYEFNSLSLRRMILLNLQAISKFEIYDL